jgi:hypothetical protein
MVQGARDALVIWQDCWCVTTTPRGAHGEQQRRGTGRIGQPGVITPETHTERACIVG